MEKTIKASDYGTATVSLIVRDATAAMAFYATVFGAKHLYSLTMPDGSIAHAEFKIGDTVVMISDENPAWGSKSPQTLGGSPATLVVQVADPDAAVAKAEKAGGKVTMPVSDHFYGCRQGKIEDPFGHSWMVSKVVEEMTPSEMQRRMGVWLASMSDGAETKAKASDAKKSATSVKAKMSDASKPAKAQASEVAKSEPVEMNATHANKPAKAGKAKTTKPKTAKTSTKITH